MRCVSFGFIFLCCWFVTNAQTNFRWLSVKDGLPSNDVQGITKDKDNFLWVGTKKGLMRYDGYRFMPSTHHDLTFSVITDNANSLFVATNNLLKIDAHSGRIDTLFKRNEFDSDPDNDHFENIFYDSRGRIWGNDFHFIKYMNPQNKSVKSFRISKELAENLLTAGFFEDKNKNIWIATQKGFFRFDEPNQRLIAISNH
jgi:ligand-binding sensor domain-containing protein